MIICISIISAHISKYSLEKSNNIFLPLRGRHFPGKTSFAWSVLISEEQIDSDTENISRLPEMLNINYIFHVNCEITFSNKSLAATCHTNWHFPLWTKARSHNRLVHLSLSFECVTNKTERATMMRSRIPRRGRQTKVKWGMNGK